jgi:hypothetical protein
MSQLENLYWITDKAAAGITIAVNKISNPGMEHPEYKENYSCISAHIFSLNTGTKKVLASKKQDATDLFISIYTSRSPLPVQRLLMALFGLEFSTTESATDIKVDAIFKDFGEDVVLCVDICDPNLSDEYKEMTYHVWLGLCEDFPNNILSTTSSQEVIDLCKKLSAMDAEEVLNYSGFKVV